MNKKTLSGFRRLLEAPSTTGYEAPAQAVYREMVTPFCDRVSTDALGNLVAARNPDGRPRVMLAAHCDEIGFVVSWINPEGFIYFQPISFAPWRIEGQRVTISGPLGPVIGTVARKQAVHMSEIERKEPPRIEDFWVDIGASSRAEAEKAVRVGDPGTFRAGLETLFFPDRAISRAFDDKAGVFILAEVMRRLAAKKSLEAAVFAVSTTQEEIGCRGAGCAAFGIEPDLAVAIDVQACTDFPGAGKPAGEVRLGGGPVIALGANIHPALSGTLEKTARRLEIPFQFNVYTGATNTDARSIQVTGAGIRTAQVGIPLRYMHTPNEMLSFRDLESIVSLLTAFILEDAPALAAA